MKRVLIGLLAVGLLIGCAGAAAAFDAAGYFLDPKPKGDYEEKVTLQDEQGDIEFTVKRLSAQKFYDMLREDEYKPDPNIPVIGLPLPPVQKITKAAFEEFCNNIPEEFARKYHFAYVTVSFKMDAPEPIIVSSLQVLPPPVPQPVRGAFPGPSVAKYTPAEGEYLVKNDINDEEPIDSPEFIDLWWDDWFDDTQAIAAVQGAIVPDFPLYLWDFDAVPNKLPKPDYNTFKVSFISLIPRDRSGGCDAGFGALGALVLLAGAAAVRGKKTRP